MKTTFDLPEPLLRRAKAAAAHQGRPLRDLVAEAIDAKLAADRAATHAASKQPSEWEAFKAQLVQQPDGTWLNPNGIEDEGFFEALDGIRHERLMQQAPREPIAELPTRSPRRKPAAARRRKPA
ncbi:MAG TPA: hypothetical protein VFA35_06585 [Burkholderiaceae bacterium]|nr:hypothetical protein [Burkholderiaceae bacterium]